MTLLYIFIGIIIFFIITLYVWNSYQKKVGNLERLEEIEADPIDNACCGQHATCEKDSLINTFVKKEIDYFDDEELDQYQGRTSENYTEHETEEFREILYTMNDDDKPRWVRSLMQRGIEIPNQLKDEIFLIVNDLRAAHTSHS